MTSHVTRAVTQDDIDTLIETLKAALNFSYATVRPPHYELTWPEGRDPDLDAIMALVAHNKLEKTGARSALGLFGRAFDEYAGSIGGMAVRLYIPDAAILQEDGVIYIKPNQP